MEVIAKLKFARISARKVRYLRPIVVNQEAHTAMSVLDHIPNRGAMILKKLIGSAVANAQQKNPDQKTWYVKNLFIDEGPRMKRLRAAPMGRAVVIMKKLSHITVVLEELPETKTIKGNKHGAKGKSNRS